MNKILVVVGVAVLAVVVWMIFQPDTIDYVREVNDEVAELETELAEIEAAMEAGTLTPEQAAEAQVRIVARIDAINTTASAGQKSKLTDAQRADLAAGLLRLADALKSYQATLIAVDASVMELPEADRPVLRRGGGGGAGKVGVAVIADEALETVEEQVDEIIDEITDEELSEEVSDSADETLGDDDEMSTTTDETMIDDSETVSEDDSVDDEETSDVDDEMQDETVEDDDSMLEVSAEAEADFGFDESENDDSTDTTQ